MPQQTPIDVIVTSCGRFDLLRRMLDSFFEYADKEYEYRVWVYDDYGYPYSRLNEPQIKDEYQHFMNQMEYLDLDIHYMCSTERVGQIAAIDYLMTHVKTDYYIHLEDDWEFVKTGWVNRSIEWLGNSFFQTYIQFWLRGLNDINRHPIEISDSGYGISRLSTDYHWKGFSFNPAVRRLSDYKLIGKYGNVATFNPKDPSSAERKIGEWYCKKGYVAGVFHEQYVRHTGDNRGIRQ